MISYVILKRDCRSKKLGKLKKKANTLQHNSRTLNNITYLPHFHQFKGHLINNTNNFTKMRRTGKMRVLRQHVNVH